jgi:hypothetical protein
MTLPRLDAYVESLPRGLDSFSDQAMKASYYLQFFDEYPLESPERLPPRLARMLTHPPPVSAWVPAVQLTGLYLGACDLWGFDDADFVEAHYRVSGRVLRGPLYRFLMMVASPKNILRGAESRWKAFHRNIDLETLHVEPYLVKFRIRYPEGLFPEIMARAYLGAFRATLEAAGGRNAKYTLVSYSATVAEYEGRWI